MDIKNFLDTGAAMVGFRFGAPEDPAERDAITLARAKFGEPTDEQVEKELIRLLFDRSNEPKGDANGG